MTVYPDGEVDRRLFATWGLVAGIDEVGRGAIAGPLAVGVVAADPSRGAPPAGLADSKQLRPAVRRQLVPQINRWSAAAAVGWASPSEICEWGMTRSLRVAALRALHLVGRQLWAAQAGRLGGILLDGKHDFLSAEENTLFDCGREAQVEDPWSEGHGVPVATLVKADQHSHLVAAASIVAKVARDDYIGSLADPGYQWASNKGYGSAAHQEGLRRCGIHRQHRADWHLPGVN